MAGYIGQVKIGSNTYPVGSMLYGTCTVAAGTAEKTVTLAAFDTLATGVTIHVSFSNANTASAPTLKVGSTAAKGIINPNGTTAWSAGAVITFTYNGANWVMNAAKGGSDDKLVNLDTLVYQNVEGTEGEDVSDIITATSGTDGTNHNIKIYDSDYVLRQAEQKVYDIVSNEIASQNGVFLASVSMGPDDNKLTFGTQTIAPSISITAGTSSDAPKVNVTVNTKSGTAQALTKATTGVYGVTKLSSATNSSATDLAATPSAVKAAYDLANGKQDPITFNTTYNASTNKAATMSDVTSATSLTFTTSHSSPDTGLNLDLTIGSNSGSVTIPYGSTLAHGLVALTNTITTTNETLALTGKAIANLSANDTAVAGEYVSEVRETSGIIYVSRVAFAPSIAITAGTGSAAPKVNVTVNGKSGTAQSITTASTSVYGVTKLSDATNSTSTALAATANAVKKAYDLANGKQDPITFNTAYNATSNKAATMADIENATSGLTGAMHFIGISSTEITDGGTEDPTIEGSAVTAKSAGDVVLYSGKEFVWTGSAWELLGDEGSYALKTNTASVIKTATLTKNTLPTLTITATSIPNVTSAGTAASLTTTTYTVPNVTAAGSAASFSVASGTLTLNTGSAPTLGTAFSIKGVNVFTANTPATLGTAISVGSASGWNAGSQASLSTSAQTVVIP